MDKDIDEPGDRDEPDGRDEPDELDDAEPWLPAGYPPPRDAAHRRWRRVTALAATAVLAAAAGFAVVTAALRDGTASPAAANASPAAPGATPSGAAPSGGGGNQLQPGSGAIPTPGRGQARRLAIGGKVAAVSATSITLGSPGRYVTASVTPATKVTGKVSDISGVKVGDMVTAQITDTDGKLTVTVIQDPASLP